MRIKYILRLTILAHIKNSVVVFPCISAENGIIWTEDELAFINEHLVIRLGVDSGFLPFEFIDEDGEYRGIAADYLALLCVKTGLHFEVVKGLSWPDQCCQVHQFIKLLDDIKML